MHSKELDYIRKLALAREAQGDLEGAVERLREGLSGYVAGSGSSELAGAASLITDMWGFCGRHPELASRSELLAAFDKFCSDGAATGADPAWLMQFFVMRAQAAATANTDLATAAHREAIAFFNGATGVPFTDAISELYVSLGDIYFKSERYAEAEQALSEGLALERLHRAAR
jgi:tetratricopeptide (TPR) repeat protein